jgi:hypothetical protein
MVTRICGNCKAEYQTFPSIRLQFCGAKCANAAKMTGEHVPCEQCGKSFYRRPCRPARFCGKSCARTALNLTTMNPAYSRDVSGEKNPMYGKGLHGEANPMFGRRRKRAPTWKGGRKVRRDGYILAVAPSDHPYPADSHPASGLVYVLEHRLVMERHLGRYLEPGEVVHHRDENPSNNALENLELFASQSDHIRLGHRGGAH